MVNSDVDWLLFVFRCGLIDVALVFQIWTDDDVAFVAISI